MAASEASSWVTTWSRFCNKCECRRVEPRLMRDSVAIIRLISLLLVSMRMAELRGAARAVQVPRAHRFVASLFGQFYVTQFA
ncbi:hypothetical protein D3C80_1774530 [compost metagenome]